MSYDGRVAPVRRWPAIWWSSWPAAAGPARSTAPGTSEIRSGRRAEGAVRGLRAATRASGLGWCASRDWRPASTTRTWCRSTTPARPTATSSSRCGSSTARISAPRCGRARWRRTGWSRSPAQIAAALDAAHEQGLVHRDVKPSNVLVDARGHCYLTDFGLSRSAGDPVRAADAALAGTVGYVAPEQVRGDDVDGRADLYALACMIFEMLTGELPFRRTTDVATLFAHLEEDPPSGRAAAARVAARPSTRCSSRGLAKDPGDRQDSCAALVDEARARAGPDASRRRAADGDC